MSDAREVRPAADARREPLYGPAGTGGPVPAGARREPLYRGGLIEWARPAPSDREPLYAGRLLELAADVAAHSEPLHGSALADGPTSTGPHREPLHAFEDVGRVIARELADRYGATRHRETLHGAGTGAPAGTPAATARPTLPDVRPWSELAAREHARRLVDDARAALAHRPAQPAQDQPRRAFTIGPELAEHIGDRGRLDHGRAALVRELAADVLAQAGRLQPDAYAAQLDTRDRMAAAILADHGPVALTGRPVHALQLADGRAFLLQDVDGRPQWQPTGPLPLTGCPTLAGPWQDQDAPQEAPQDVDEQARLRAAGCRCRIPGRIADTVHTPDCPAGPTNRRRNPAPTSKDRRRNGPGTDGSQAPDVARAWDDIRRAQRERTRPAPHRHEPCPLDPTAGPRSVRCLPPQDQEPPQRGAAHPCPLADGAPCTLTPGALGCCQDVDDAPRELAGTLCGIHGRPCLDPCPAAQGTGALCGRYSAPQELAGPSTPGPGRQERSGRHGRPACQLGHCPFPVTCPGGCYPGTRRRPAGQDGPRCERGAGCPFPVPCVGPCHASTLRRTPDDARADALRLVEAGRLASAAGLPEQARKLATLARDALQDVEDVEDLADLAHSEALHAPDVDELAGRVRDAGTWTRNEYTLRVEPAALLHREPLHAFTDAAAQDARDARRCPARGHQCALTCEDRHDCAQQADQRAHDAVTAAARACTCTTRQPHDPPCPIAGPHPPAQEA